MDSEADEWIEDDRVAARRGRARSLLPEITRDVKLALGEAGIDLDVFVIIPATGAAIAVFGTVSNPPDDVWQQVIESVSSIVREAIGSERLWFREVSCATTADQPNCPTSTPMSSLS